MVRIAEESGEPAKNIKPLQVLQVLQLAISHDSRLKTPPEEIAKHLIHNGDLPMETPIELVNEMLGIMREGGVGLRSPKLQPCSIEFFWDPESGHVSDTIDLSMSVDWTGVPPPWEDRTIPPKITHDKSRLCTDLIVNPEAVLSDRERWPLHICEPEFTSQSTSLWAEAQSFANDNLNNHRWASMYPLPIGKRALMIRPGMTDTSAWSEVFGVLPFEEYEQAMWALRVRYRERATVHTLDLFGLAEYPDELHQRLAVPVAGKLAFVVRGHGRRTIDLLDAAEKWWGQFLGLSTKGRTKGTGTWKDRGHFLTAISEATQQLRAEGTQRTQDNLGACFNTDGAGLRRWLRQFRLSWRGEEIQKVL